MTSAHIGKGVIFDLDGVLVDTGWAHRQAIQNQQTVLSLEF
jgi:beta-phosphoglucomutase-like phosphatase (HAD superfamily)